MMSGQAWLVHAKAGQAATGHKRPRRRHRRSFNRTAVAEAHQYAGRAKTCLRASQRKEPRRRGTWTAWRLKRRQCQSKSLVKKETRRNCQTCRCCALEEKLILAKL